MSVRLGRPAESEYTDSLPHSLNRCCYTVIAMKIDQQYLKSILDYKPETGVFVWKFRPETCRKNKHFNAIWGGKIAGSEFITKKGYKYWKLYIDGRFWLAHRAAFLYMAGYIPKEIDHKDRNGQNNAWMNLCACTRGENMRNKSLYKSSTSGLAGVTWHKGQGKWSARVQIDGKRKTLGSFDTKEEAAAAVKQSRKSLGFSDGHGKQRML